MTSNELPKSRLIEFDSIRVDADFYLNLMLQLNSYNSSGILIFGLVPFLSLFVVETYNYLQNMLPAYATALSKLHEKIIRSSRMRTKFFDDSAKRVDGMFELLSWIAQFHHEWYIRKHKGFLAPLKRALQYDLGIFVYSSHIIGSTHTGLINLGFERGDLPTTDKEISATIGSLSRLIGVEIGRYVARLSQLPEFASSSSNTSYFAYKIADEKLGYKDEKSTMYFSSVFNGAGVTEINFSLLLFLVTVNFLGYILKQLVTDSPVTLFKLKFITLHHLSSSLEKLRNYYYPKGVLTNRSKKYFQSILEDKDLESIKRQSSFRNILVHYKIEGVPDNSLSYTTKLYGLVEHFFDGATYDDVNRKLDDQITRVSLILEEWLSWRIQPNWIKKWDFSSW
jgi:hypothetical protein